MAVSFLSTWSSINRIFVCSTPQLTVSEYQFARLRNNCGITDLVVVGPGRIKSVKLASEITV